MRLSLGISPERGLVSSFHAPTSRKLYCPIVYWGTIGFWAEKCLPVMYFLSSDGSLRYRVMRGLQPQISSARRVRSSSSTSLGTRLVATSRLETTSTIPSDVALTRRLRLVICICFFGILLSFQIGFCFIESL